MGECCRFDETGDGGSSGSSFESASSRSHASNSKSNCRSCSAINHIIEATGNIYLQISPFKLEGVGLPIEPVLTYNSKSPKIASPYGRGWFLNYDRRIKILDDERTRLECEDGRGNVYTYKLNLDGTTYTAKKRHHQTYSTLYRDGDDYIEEYKSGTKYRFIMDGDYGYISNITDRHGNALTFERDEDHKITSITDSSGRTVTFQYSSNKLKKIIPPSPGDGTPTPIYEFSCGANLNSYETPEGSLTTFTYDADYLMTGREHNGEEIQYLYEDSDDPRAVTERKKIINGHTYSRTFSYNRTESTTTIVDEAGFTHINKYDDFGDTVSYTAGTAFPKISTWGADGKRILDMTLNGKGTRYSYDDRGNMTFKQEVEPKEEGDGYDWGLSHEYEYDESDNLIAETDSLGRVINYEYDENGNRTKKIQTVTDPDTGQPQEVIHSWSYYTNGLLESETDPNGNVTSYEYDSYGNPINIQLKDPQGGIAREEVMQYNALNWLKHKEERIDASRWRVTDYMYDKEGRTLTIIYNGDPGDYEENTYDCCNLISKSDRNGNITTYEYHDSGKLWKEIRNVGDETYLTEYNYNGRYELVSLKTYAEVEGEPQNVRETTYEHNARGRRTKVTDALGNDADYVYNDHGGLISETRYLDGRPIVTSYEYDGYGRLIKLTRQIDEITTADTQYKYDITGRMTKVIDPLDRETSYEYGELDRVIRITQPLGKVTEYRYDDNGNRIKVIDALGIETTYTYNALNKVTSITQPVNEGSIASVITNYEYDCLGNRTLVTDGKGNQTQYDYNLDGRLETVTDAEGHTIGYTYRPGGQLKTLTDANNKTTNYTYNYANHFVKIEYAYGTPKERAETFTYDNVGNMLSKILRSGETITYEYDLLNRMTKKILPGDPVKTVDYAYDDLGRMTSVTDENGTISYSYDDANRLLSVTYPSDPPKTVSYAYDLVGNRTKLTYTDTTWIDYTYDDLNRMDQVENQDANILADYSYDSLRRTRLDYLYGTYVTYEYNDTNWITDLYNTKESQGDISYFTYTHDEVGNRKTMTTAQGTHTYSYDNIYQLTGVDYPAGHPFADKTYNYDPVGNRKQVIEGATTTYHNYKNCTYEPDPLNEYYRVTTDCTGEVSNYTYDDRGNITSDGTNTYTYDLENRLTTITGSTTASYSYDSFGKRIEKNAGGTVTKYIYAGDQVIEEWEGGQLVRKFIYGVGIDEPLVLEAGGNRFYYHFDSLGSVRNLSDSTGASVASYEYDVYGEFQLTGSSHGNPYTFTGRRYNSESGLYYYRARYYSPAIGRFLQIDPIGYYSGPNLYTYVTNDPVNSIDPMGLQSWRNCPPGQVWGQKAGGVVPAADGCSNPIPIPGRGDKDNPTGQCSFKAACNNHDDCYSDCSESQKDCDDVFKQDMLDACRSCTSRMPPGETRDKFQKKCEWWADKYEWGVNTFGSGPYRNRQTQNCGCICPRPS